jgi:hypothetical protein
MIVSALDQTQQVLRTYTQFLQDRQQQQQLRETLEWISKFHQAIKTFVDHYTLLEPRLRNSLPSDVANRVLSIQGKLLASRTAFDSSRWQVRLLKQILDETDRLNQVLLETWQAYVEQAIQPKRELYRLLAELPEIRSRQQMFKDKFDFLGRLARVLPGEHAMLQTFDDHLSNLTTLLTDVEGVTPVIQNFLQQVHQGRFTIADLNDEILTWCSVNDRGKSFMIKA